MPSRHIQTNILGNRIQSGLLILAMASVLSVLGFLLGGTTGLLIAIAVCLVTAIFGPRISPTLVLKMYKARELPREAAPGLHDIFRDIVSRAGLKTTPKLYYVPSRTLNAFAVGTQDNAAVAVTDGLLRILDAREMAGVLAHEVSHIRHHDIRVLGIADSVSRLTASISQIGQVMLLFAVPAALASGDASLLLAALVMIAAPMITALMQLALSRAREFNADLGAIGLTGDAVGLASALNKLQRISTGGAPWIFAGKKTQTVPAMLRTHPATDERIRRIFAAGESLRVQQAAEQFELPPVREKVAPPDYPRVRRGPRWHVAGLWY